MNSNALKNNNNHRNYSNSNTSNNSSGSANPRVDSEIASLSFSLSNSDSYELFYVGNPSLINLQKSGVVEKLQIDTHIINNINAHLLTPERHYNSNGNSVFTNINFDNKLTDSLLYISAFLNHFCHCMKHHGNDNESISQLNIPSIEDLFPFGIDQWKSIKEQQKEFIGTKSNLVDINKCDLSEIYYGLLPNKVSLWYKDITKNQIQDDMFVMLIQQTNNNENKKDNEFSLWILVRNKNLTKKWRDIEEKNEIIGSDDETESENDDNIIMANLSCTSNAITTTTSIQTTIKRDNTLLSEAVSSLAKNYSGTDFHQIQEAFQRVGDDQGENKYFPNQIELVRALINRIMFVHQIKFSSNNNSNTNSNNNILSGSNNNIVSIDNVSIAPQPSNDFFLGLNSLGFLISTADFTSLREQTASRLVKKNLDTVEKYINNNNQNQDIDEINKIAETFVLINSTNDTILRYLDLRKKCLIEPSFLFVKITDEAHNAMSPSGFLDLMKNDNLDAFINQYSFSLSVMLDKPLKNDISHQQQVKQLILEECKLNGGSLSQNSILSPEQRIECFIVFSNCDKKKLPIDEILQLLNNSFPKFHQHCLSYLRNEFSYRPLKRAIEKMLNIPKKQNRAQFTMADARLIMNCLIIDIMDGIVQSGKVHDDPLRRYFRLDLTMERLGKHWSQLEFDNENFIFRNEALKSGSLLLKCNSLVLEVTATPYPILTIKSKLPNMKARRLINDIRIDDTINNNENIHYRMHQLLLENSPILKDPRFHLKTIPINDVHVIAWADAEYTRFKVGGLFRLLSNHKNDNNSLRLNKNRYVGLNESNYLVGNREGDAAFVFKINKADHGYLSIQCSENNNSCKCPLLKGPLYAIPLCWLTFMPDFSIGCGLMLLRCTIVNKSSNTSDIEWFYIESTLNQLNLINAGTINVDQMKRNSSMQFAYQIIDPQLGQYRSLNEYINTMDDPIIVNRSIRSDRYSRKIIELQPEVQKDLYICEYVYSIIYYQHFLTSVDPDSTLRNPKVWCEMYDEIVQLLQSIENFKYSLNKATMLWICKSRFLCGLTKLDHLMFRDSITTFRTQGNHWIMDPKSNEVQEKRICDYLLWRNRGILAISGQTTEPNDNTDYKKRLKDFLSINDELYSHCLAAAKLANAYDDLKQHKYCKLIKMNDAQLCKLNGLFTETEMIINDVLTNANKKMKVIRTGSSDEALKYVYWLKRLLAVESLKSKCLVLADFDKQNLSDSLQKLDECWKFQIFNGKCQSCKCIKFQSESLYKQNASNWDLCKNCECQSKRHRRVRCYEDLNEIPCILILRMKGRMGDTFPDSFDCLDDRASSSNEKDLAPLVQKLGRLCHYATEATAWRYALISHSLEQKLHEARGTGISSLTLNPHIHMTKINSKSQIHSTDYRNDYEPLFDNLDYHQTNNNNNKDEHSYRFLLFAEPQIGKTGSFLLFLHCLDTAFRDNTHPSEVLQQIDDSSKTYRVIFVIEPAGSTIIRNAINEENEDLLFDSTELTMEAFLVEGNDSVQKIIDQCKASYKEQIPDNAEYYIMNLNLGYEFRSELLAQENFGNILPDNNDPIYIVCHLKSEGNLSFNIRIEEMDGTNAVTKSIPIQSEQEQYNILSSSNADVLLEQLLKHLTLYLSNNSIINTTNITLSNDNYVISDFVNECCSLLRKPSCDGFFCLSSNNQATLFNLIRSTNCQEIFSEFHSLFHRASRSTADGTTFTLRVTWKPIWKKKLLMLNKLADKTLKLYKSYIQLLLTQITIPFSRRSCNLAISTYRGYFSHLYQKQKVLAEWFTINPNPLFYFITYAPLRSVAYATLLVQLFALEIVQNDNTIMNTCLNIGGAMGTEVIALLAAQEHLIDLKILQQATLQRIDILDQDSYDNNKYNSINAPIAPSIKFGTVTWSSVNISDYSLILAFYIFVEMYAQDPSSIEFIKRFELQIIKKMRTNTVLIIADSMKTEGLLVRASIIKSFQNNKGRIKILCQGTQSLNSKLNFPVLENVNDDIWQIINDNFRKLSTTYDQSLNHDEYTYTHKFNQMWFIVIQATVDSHPVNHTYSNKRKAENDMEFETKQDIDNKYQK